MYARMYIGGDLIIEVRNTGQTNRYIDRQIYLILLHVKEKMHHPSWHRITTLHLYTFIYAYIYTFIYAYIYIHTNHLHVHI